MDINPIIQDLLCAGECDMKMKKYIRISIYIIVYLYLIYPSISFLIMIICGAEYYPNWGFIAFGFLPPLIPGLVIDIFFSLIILQRGHSGATYYITGIFNIILWTIVCLSVYIQRSKILKNKSKQNLDKPQEKI